MPNPQYRSELVASTVHALTQNLYAAAAENSEGWHLSGISIGVLNLSIPFIGFRFTNLETKWSLDQNSLKRARFERGVLAGATDLGALPDTLGTTTEQKVENYFRDAWTDRPSPVNYWEKDGYIYIKSSRGIQTDGVELDYTDVSYSNGTMRIPKGKYDIHLSRMLH